jgi:outer membrane protein TolC
MRNLFLFMMVIVAGSWSFAGAAGEGGVMSLEQSEEAALATHPTLSLAVEESRVAELKKAEAYRAVWPLASIKGEITEGAAERTLGTPDFLEESYGVQVTQTVIQGGRLVRAYKQAKANWLSVQAKEEKARQEVLFGARESYWNLVKAIQVEQLFGKALDDLEKERTMADQLEKNEILSRQVILTIRGQYEQAVLNRASAEAETVSRLWQWVAALGLNEPPADRPVAQISPVNEKVVRLEDCLSEARSVHPDLSVQRYASEAAHYGDLVGRALYMPRLSINGFYGRSGAAYENETFEMKEDWNLGARISQYFGGSSLNASAMEIRTSPKLGQSTRTQSRTYAGSVGIEDSLKLKTEKAEAAFSSHQAAEELRRTEMEVANGVRTAYADYMKSRSQALIAKTDLSLAKTEYDVSRIKSTSREIPVSDRSLSRNRWAQAEASWVDAQAQLHIAGAALARAIGRPYSLVKENQ